MSNLVIVESPAKAETIEKYLPGDFNVRASFGHVRDLPDNKSQLPEKYRNESWAKLGVNTEQNFEPVYVVNDSQSKKALKDLRKALNNADELYLATDEDREGEAISWHLVEELRPEQPAYRMVFHEITQQAIEEALENPRDIDNRLVEAQEARRILDRLVGYPLSLLVAKKIKYGLSAGRVQSPAVRLLVERERSRRRFTVGTYWDLKGTLDKDGNQFEADLRSIDGTRLAAGRDFDRNTGQIPDDKDVVLLDEEDADQLQQKLEGKEWTVQNVEERDYTSSPKPPFITSTLQQAASRKLGMSAGQTMSIAQMLYENGHITYMRTDSVNLSDQAISAARKAGGQCIGSDYVNEKPRYYQSQSNMAQEAHEAIRPTGDTFTHPDDIDVRGRAKQLYDLIWKRTVASQMADAKKTSIRVDTSVEVDDSELVFRANGTRINFAGFIAAYLDNADDPEAVLNSKETSIPDMASGDSVSCIEIDTVKHETKPPSRYTEASLVEALEDEGVGRPSTYATIMSKLKRDGRYAKTSGKALVPTYVAFAVTQLLEEHFPNLVDLKFTAHMEEDLDEIARGEGSKVEYLDRFYRKDGGFADQIKEGEENIEPDEARIVKLEDFEGTLRVGRYGPYAEIEHEGEKKTVDVPEDIPPADLEFEEVMERLKERQKGPDKLGAHPDNDKPIYLMNGRYGHYIQLGEREEGNGKPKTASIPDSKEPEDVTLEDAVELLSLPRKLGEHPDSGNPVEASIGPYGPYVRHKNNYESLDSEGEVFEIELDEALSKLKSKNKKGKNILKELGEDPDSGEELNVLDGRYGPYVNLGDTNASIPSDMDPEAVTRDEAMELIEEKRSQ